MNGILLNKSDPDSVSPHKEHCKPLKQGVTPMCLIFKGFDPNGFFKGIDPNGTGIRI